MARFFYWRQKLSKTIEKPADAASADNESMIFIKDYYGRKLETKEDLKESACCALDTASQFSEIFKLIPKEVTDKHYGCGVPVPTDDLTGLKVLDLGSGSGVDVFILAHKVGPTGFVHGVDMTPEQVYVAKRNIPAVMQNFGYQKPNV